MQRGVDIEDFSKRKSQRQAGDLVVWPQTSREQLHPENIQLDNGIANTPKEAIESQFLSNNMLPLPTNPERNSSPKTKAALYLHPTRHPL